jgi:membrane associated rhomboid family serine protease
MTPWVMRLLVANVAIYLLQRSTPEIVYYGAYVPALVLQRPWSIVSYMFLHGSFSHILFNMIGLFFFGTRVESRLGGTRFFWLYFLSGIAGAAAQTIFSFTSPMIGASAGVFGVMMAFAMFWPRDQIMIWGVLPVEARVLVVFSTIFALFSGATGSRDGTAHWAHLGGYAGAFVYLYYLKQTAGNKRFRAKVHATPPAVEKKLRENIGKVNLTGVHEITKEEVNRILDKISAEGMGSLTAQEKLFLSNFVPLDDRKPVS